jgi:hypothetical protein
MGERHHYVSQFHLKAFTTTDAKAPLEPWLWVADCRSGSPSLSRRAPKNIGWARDLFAGSGALAERHASLEDFLAREVEAPAAVALRALLAAPVGTQRDVPAVIVRYLAWAAARNLPMQTLFQQWNDEADRRIDAVEPPPDGLDRAVAITRVHTLQHAASGAQREAHTNEVEALLDEGWSLVVKDDDFLELVHIQAWYFQMRFFPRFVWFILDAPPETYFVTGDRPVVWHVDNQFGIPSRALRHPRARLLAPLSRTVCLFACHPESVPESITPDEVNRVVALSASQWVAGSSQQAVLSAIAHRERELPQLQ